MNGMARMALGALVGVGIGLALYRFVGCRTGACPLTANPWVAAVLWGLFGAMAASGR